MESIVYNQTEFVDGRISFSYLIRNNADVRIADAVLPAGTDVAGHGTAHAETLYNVGYAPPAKVSPLALFQATKNKDAQSIHIGAIFAAFQQLQMGGSMSDMKVAAKQVYAQSDEQLAAVTAFITQFQNASEADRNELVAIAIYAASSLVTL